MKTASVRDLRNRYTSVFRWIDAGEEVLITRRGKPVARLVPESPLSTKEADWSQSPAVKRDRSGSRIPTGKEASELIREAGGKW